MELLETDILGSVVFWEALQSQPVCLVNGDQGIWPGSALIQLHGSLEN